MTNTGIFTLDNAPHVLTQWLDELCEDLDWDDRAAAFRLMRETLHATRDLLSVDEAAHLAAQLPVLVRGIYYEGWDPSQTPVRQRNKSDMIARIEAHFDKNPLTDPDRAVAAVFDLLRRHVSFGEFEQVRNAMRKPIRELMD